MRKSNRVHIFSYFVVMIFSLLLTILFFNTRQLFSNTFIPKADYPIYYFNSYNIIDLLYPVFKSTFGFNLDFYAGFPIIQMYPSGLYYLMSIMYFIGIDLNISIRILLFVTIFLFIQLPFFLLKYYNFPSLLKTLSVLLMVFWANKPLWFQYIDGGVITYQITLVFGMILLFRNISFISNSPEDKKIKINFIFGNIILLVIIVLLDFWVAILLATFISVIIFVEFLKSKSKISLLSNVKIQFTYIIPSIFLVGFWLIPTLIFQFPERHPMNYPIYSLEISRLIWEHIHSQLPLFLLIFTTIIISLINPKFLKMRNISWNRLEQYISITALVSLFFSTIVPEFQIDLLLGNNSARWYVVFEILTPVIFCSLLFKISQFGYTNFKRMKNTGNKFSKKQYFRSYFGKNFQLFVVISVIIMLIFTFRFDNSYTFKSDLIQDYINYPGNSETYSNLRPEVVDTFEWIEENVTSSSRILIEDSADESNYKWGGLVLSMAPKFTNKSFIGGFTPYYWYKYSESAGCYEGIAFEKSFDDMSLEFFIENLNFYNIEYLVLWSDSGKSFLNSHDKFDFVINFDQFFIYKFNEYNGSYYYLNNNKVEGNLIKFEENEIIVELGPVNQGDTYKLSVHNFYNWNVQINGMNKIKNISSEFLIYTFNQNYNENVTIRFFWKTSGIEYFSSYLSGICLILMPIIYVVIRKDYHVKNLFFLNKKEVNYTKK